MRELRFPKRSSRSHRKAKFASLTSLSRLFKRAPKTGNGAALMLTWQPPQAPDEMPPATARCAGPAQGVDLDEAARRVAGTFSGHFRLNGDMRLFRDDDMTWSQFEKSRQARLARMQDLVEPWAAPGAVNLGRRHGPKTLVFSLTDHNRFSDGTDTQPAVKP